MLLQQGTVLGKRYEVLEKIGAGGMAIVYKAKDKKLERFVTVKILREEFVADEEFVKRFRVEAQSAASLNHSNIVSVYDVGQEGSTYYIVMEYIKGETLKEFIARKAPLDNDTIITMAMQMASALGHAHSNHVVHRDIKPQNILVTADGIIKVTDFGIARAATTKTVSMTGSAIGSVHYFSPEQARGSFADEKSDIYSFGIVLYEMVTGKIPFNGDSHVTVALKQINEDVPKITDPGNTISKSLKLIIDKCVQKKSDDRYQEASEIYKDLKRALTDNTGTFVKKQNYNNSITVELSDKDIKKIRSEAKNKPGVNQDDITNMYMDTDPDELGAAYKPRGEAKTKRPSADEDVIVEEEEGNDKLVIVLAVITSIIIISLLVYFGARFLFPKASTEEPTENPTETPQIADGFVIVPNVVGKQFSEAQEEALALGITLVRTERSYEDIPEGEITWQELTEGGSIPPSISEMEVYVSTGAKKYPVSDVRLKLEQEAVDTLTQDIPNVVVDVQYDYSDDVVFGAVFSQEPAGSTELAAGSTVTLYVSLGVKVEKAIVPNTRGMKEADAVKQLEALKFVVGTPTYTESETVAEGLVISQTLEADTEVNERSRISLVISKGKAAQPQTPPGETTPPTTNTTEPNNELTPKKEKKTFTLQPILLDEEAETVVVVLIMTTGARDEVVYEKELSRSELPVKVDVEASGTVNLKLFMNDIMQWSDTITFAEGE